MHFPGVRAPYIAVCLLALDSTLKDRLSPFWRESSISTRLEENDGAESPPACLSSLCLFHQKRSLWFLTGRDALKVLVFLYRSEESTSDREPLECKVGLFSLLFNVIFRGGRLVRKHEQWKWSSITEGRIKHCSQGARTHWNRGCPRLSFPAIHSLKDFHDWEVKPRFCLQWC